MGLDGLENVEMEGLDMVAASATALETTVGDGNSVTTFGSQFGRPVIPPPPPFQASQMQESQASVPGSPSGSGAGPTGSPEGTEDSPAMSGGVGA